MSATMGSGSRRAEGRVTASRWLCALSLMLTAGASPSAVYKWVDEQGVTHYSEKPPQGKKPTEVPIRSQPAPAANQDAPSAAKTWQQQEAEFQQRRIEQEEQRMKKEAFDRAATADRKRACLDARHDLHILEQQRPVYTINHKGERVYVEDKNRDQLRDRLRQIAEQTCDK